MVLHTQTMGIFQKYNAQTIHGCHGWTVCERKPIHVIREKINNSIDSPENRPMPFVISIGRIDITTGGYHPANMYCPHISSR